MRHFSKFAFAAVLIAAAVSAFAQATKITIKDPYAQQGPAGADTFSVYMTIINRANEPDCLTGATAEIAAQVQLYEMYLANIDNGVIEMRLLTRGLDIPPARSVTFEPGSYRVMLVGLKKPLSAGETFSLTLNFEKAGPLPLTVPVKPMG